MLLLNIDHVPGREIEALSIVKGTVVQSKNFGKDFMAGRKTLGTRRCWSRPGRLPPSAWWTKPRHWERTPL